MNIENIKNIFKGALNKHLSEKTKIYTTISGLSLLVILLGGMVLKALRSIKALDGMNGFGLVLYLLVRHICSILFGEKRTNKRRFFSPSLIWFIFSY